MEPPTIIHSIKTNGRGGFQAGTAAAGTYFKLNATDIVSVMQNYKQAKVLVTHYKTMEPQVLNIFCHVVLIWSLHAWRARLKKGCQFFGQVRTVSWRIRRHAIQNLDYEVANQVIKRSWNIVSKCTTKVSNPSIRRQILRSKKWRGSENRCLQNIRSKVIEPAQTGRAP